MKLYRLHEKQTLPITLGQAWKFFSDPHNLALITPPDLGLRVDESVPHECYAGQVMSYKVKVHFVLRVTWVTEITQVIPEKMFVDEQRFGPYKLWHHEHHFREVEGGTECEDLIHYALPYGWLGQLARELKVKHDLEKIFSYRREVLKNKFGTVE